MRQTTFLNSIIKMWWPAIVAVVVLWVMLAVMIFQIIRLNDGQYVYPLDDAYIHLSIAKNLSQHGVWGVTQYETSSASSSILWTLLLAGVFNIGGVSSVAPLAINVVLASILLVLLDWFFRRNARLNAHIRCVLLLVCIVLLALPILSLNGMEHVIQIIAALLLTILGARAIASKTAPRRSWFVLFLILGALVTAARYEGVFVAVPLVGLLLLRRRFGSAGFLFLGAALPVVLFGVYSLLHGQMFLPNSLVVKSLFASLRGWSEAIAILPPNYLAVFRDKPYLFVLVVIMVWRAILLWRKERWSFDAVFALAALSVLAAQAALTVGSWDLRYDMYAVTIGLCALAPLARIMPSLPSTRSAMIRVSFAGILCLLFLLPLGIRTTFRIGLLASSTREIFEQQIQLGRFFRQYYPGAVIAANDIGALTYFGDIRLFDVVGLAASEVVRERRRADYRVSDVEQFAENRGVEIAFVYDAWFAVGILPRPAPPVSWRPVGQWATASKIVVGGRVVSFYAVAPDSDERLIANLQDFSDDLPPSVEQGGRYTGLPDLHE